MIHYALRCAAGHAFDGWFKGSASFDSQAAGGLLQCPVCGDSFVQRAMMAPRLNRGVPAPRVPSGSQNPSPNSGPGAPPAQAAAPAARAPHPMPDQMRAALQRIRAHVEKSCDYVGPDFPDLARRIHAGVEPQRAIYGEATPEEADSLAEDGIAVAQVPWIPRADS